MVAETLTYPYPSRAVPGDAGSLTLALATVAPEIDGEPAFFDAWLTRPRLVAALLLGMGAVARARYFRPGATRLLDPILTSGEDLLRLEAFSSCCGVYARADLTGELFRAASTGVGTTNVDLNPAMREALSRIDDAGETRLSVGRAGVAVTNRTEVAVERRVALPRRWVTGLGGAALAQVGMAPVAELEAVAARRLLADLPPAGRAGAPPYSLLGSAAGYRFSQTRALGAASIAGPHRLAELRPLGRYATGMRVWAKPGAGASAWELTVPGARVWFVLSADVTHGFSGEGGALEALADSGDVAEALALRGRLGWQSRVDEAELAAATGEPVARVRRLLSVLGSQGLVGWDLDTCAWYRRDLPFAPDLIPKLAPRVRRAAAIPDADVEVHERDGGGYEVFVRSRDIEHRVVLDGEDARCTCQWYTRHGGSRGPCRHVLAARRRVAR